MPKSWAALADGSEGVYVENDFKQALYQLVCSQVLYARELNHSVAYGLISQYKTEFREAADLLGLRLEFNDTHRFCYVVPYVAKQQRMDTLETLLVLVLRRLYNDKGVSGNLDAGEAVVSIDELVSAFRAATGRDLPKSAVELKELILRQRRYGIAKPGEPSEGDPQPFTIVILPAIAELLSDSALSRLGAYQQAAVELADDAGDADAEDEGGSRVQ